MPNCLWLRVPPDIAPERGTGGAIGEGVGERRLRHGCADLAEAELCLWGNWGKGGGGGGGGLREGKCGERRDV